MKHLFPDTHAEISAILFWECEEALLYWFLQGAKIKYTKVSNAGPSHLPRLTPAPDSHPHIQPTPFPTPSPHPLMIWSVCGEHTLYCLLCLSIHCLFPLNCCGHTSTLPAHLWDVQEPPERATCTPPLASAVCLTPPPCNTLPPPTRPPSSKSSQAYAVITHIINGCNRLLEDFYLLSSSRHVGNHFQLFKIARFLLGNFIPRATNWEVSFGQVLDVRTGNSLVQGDLAWFVRGKCWCTQFFALNLILFLFPRNN